MARKSFVKEVLLLRHLTLLKCHKVKRLAGAATDAGDFKIEHSTRSTLVITSISDVSCRVFRVASQ